VTRLAEHSAVHPQLVLIRDPELIIGAGRKGTVR
jgi:hypothetical protein